MGKRGSTNIESPAISSSVPSGNGQITWIHFLALTATVWHCESCESAFFCRLEGQRGLARGSGRIWLHHSSQQINFHFCLPLLPWMFLLSVQNRRVEEKFCSSPHKTSRYEIVSIHFYSQQMEERRLIPICSYQASVTQLPSGSFLTLHKIGMTSSACWARLFSFFPLLFLQGTANPPSQHEQIDALSAWPHVRHESDSDPVCHLYINVFCFMIGEPKKHETSLILKKKALFIMQKQPICCAVYNLFCRE